MKKLYRTALCFAGLLGLSGLPHASEAAEYLIEFEGQSVTFPQLQARYRDCRALENQRPQRGEYETLAEYNERLRRLSGDCDRFSNISDARLVFPVQLSYDADRERFNFRFPSSVDQMGVSIRSLIQDKSPDVIYADRVNSYGFVRSPSMLMERAASTRRYNLRTSGVFVCGLKNARYSESYFFRIREGGECDVSYWPARIRTTRIPFIGTEYSAERGTPWNKIDQELNIRSFNFYLYSRIHEARQLRAKMDNLVFHFYGTLSVPDRRLQVDRVTMNDLEEDRVLFELSSE